MLKSIDWVEAVPFIPGGVPSEKEFEPLFGRAGESWIAGLLHLRRNHLIAHLELSRDVHALDDLAEDGVISVQMRMGAQ